MNLTVADARLTERGEVKEEGEVSEDEENKRAKSGPEQGRKGLINDGVG